MSSLIEFSLYMVFLYIALSFSLIQEINYDPRFENINFVALKNRKFFQITLRRSWYTLIECEQSINDSKIFPIDADKI